MKDNSTIQQHNELGRMNVVQQRWASLMMSGPCTSMLEASSRTAADSKPDYASIMPVMKKSKQSDGALRLTL